MVIAIGDTGHVAQHNLLETAGWVSYTPTTANLTLGDGTVVGSYMRVGNVVSFLVTFTMGSTSAMGTSPSFTLPVTAQSTTFTGLYALLGDFGTGNFIGYATPTTTVVAPKAVNVAGTYASTSNPTSTIPFTWTTNDFITIGGTYRAA
jgi:hypothetical protein